MGQQPEIASESTAAHRVLDEHAVVGAQQLGNEQLEELLLHAARIDALLPDKVHPQWLEQVSRPLPCDLVQRILLAPNAVRRHPTGPMGRSACMGWTTTSKLMVQVADSATCKPLHGDEHSRGGQAC